MTELASCDAFLVAQYVFIRPLSLLKIEKLFQIHFQSQWIIKMKHS